MGMVCVVCCNTSSSFIIRTSRARLVVRVLLQSLIALCFVLRCCMCVCVCGGVFLIVVQLPAEQRNRISRQHLEISCESFTHHRKPAVRVFISDSSSNGESSHLCYLSARMLLLLCHCCFSFSPSPLSLPPIISGTLVNGEPVAKQQKHRLKNGDKIAVLFTEEVGTGKRTLELGWTFTSDIGKVVHICSNNTPYYTCTHTHTHTHMPNYTLTTANARASSFPLTHHFFAFFDFFF